jgi:hypothetical protein
VANTGRRQARDPASWRNDCDCTAASTYAPGALQHLLLHSQACHPPLLTPLAPPSLYLCHTALNKREPSVVSPFPPLLEEPHCEEPSLLYPLKTVTFVMSCHAYPLWVWLGPAVRAGRASCARRGLGSIPLFLFCLYQPLSSACNPPEVPLPSLSCNLLEVLLTPPPLIPITCDLLRVHVLGGGGTPSLTYLLFVRNPIAPHTTTSTRLPPSSPLINQANRPPTFLLYSVWCLEAMRVRPNE